MLNGTNYLQLWPNSHWRAGGSDSSGKPGYTAWSFAPAQKHMALGGPKGSPSAYREGMEELEPGSAQPCRGGGQQATGTSLNMRHSDRRSFLPMRTPTPAAEVVEWVNPSSQCWTCPLDWCNPGKAHKAALGSLAQNHSFVSDALFSHLDRGSAKCLVLL